MRKAPFLAIFVLVPWESGCGAGGVGPAETRPPARTRASRASEAERRFGAPVMLVARPDTPPAIDGKLDDPAWKKAKAVRLGYLEGLLEEPTQTTDAMVLADGRAVYFGVRCRESEPGRMISAGGEHDGALWRGDTVELWLDPGHREDPSSAVAGTATEGDRRYFHVIVSPAGLTYDGRGKDKAWDPKLEAAAGRFEDGWTVELAVPFEEMGIASDAIPTVWGLNVTRSRPMLGVRKPLGSTFHPSNWRLDDPAEYRDPEESAWAPTSCDSSHVPERFGHAVFEVGSVETRPPEKLIEIIAREGFDDGEKGLFSGGAVVGKGFGGTQRCLAVEKGRTVVLDRRLDDLRDLTLVFALRLEGDGSGRLYYFGRAKDGMQCRAGRTDVFFAPEERAAQRFPALDMYNTHADKMTWMVEGREYAGIGPWSKKVLRFGEPNIGCVLRPGTDWVIVRTRVAHFHRQTGQNPVPDDQTFPSLVFHPGGDVPRALLDEVVVFRGTDAEPPPKVEGVRVEREGEDYRVTWRPARDNVITAFYTVRVGDPAKPGEAEEVRTRVPAARIPLREGKVWVVAEDLYGNASTPSEPVALE